MDAHRDDHLLARVDALAARVEALEAENAALRAERATPPTDAPARPMGRRAVMTGAAGLAAAAAAASVVAAEPAAANDPNDITLGGTKITSAATRVNITGTSAPFGLAFADTAADLGNPDAAVVGHAAGSAFGVGVLGGTDGGGTAVRGKGNTGYGGHFTATGTVGDGVRAEGDRYGVIAIGRIAAIFVGGTSTAAPAESTLAGALYARVNEPGAKELWFRTGATVDSWRKLASTDTAGSLHLLPAPVRAYDSRPDTPGPGPKTKLPANYVSRTISLVAAGVPVGARGALLTVLLDGASNEPGNMTVWAADKPKPTGRTMVWGGNAGRFTTSATTAVDATAQVRLDALFPTHVVIDVVGYYQ